MSYDHINPQHYRNYGKEVIDMMVDIYGAETTATYCEMTAFKYRMRAGTKPDNPVEQDLKKRGLVFRKSKRITRN